MLVMGLAASQARLLTITSRLSSNELRQQSIANMKMRLANDSEKVSSDYSKALNNQTLKIDDQTLTYETLRAAGYGVMRTGDNFTAAAYTSNDVQMPTCKKPNEIDPIKYVTRTETKTETVNIPAVTQTMSQYDYLQSIIDENRAIKIQKYEGIADYTATMQLMVPVAQKLSAALRQCGIESDAKYMDGKISEAQEAIEKAVSNNYHNSSTGTYKISMNMYPYKHLYSAFTIVSNTLFDKKDEYSNKNITVEVEPARTETKETTYEYTEQDPTDVARYNNEYIKSKAAWDAYYSAVAGAGSQEQVNFAQQLHQSPEFLIQGLLSGYLTLVNSNGDAVSLASATEITTEYDKTDDAAAEAVYNTEMSKINRKEKQLDQQAKQLDTEYQALTTELESIKSVISNHASKDFELFS